MFVVVNYHYIRDDFSAPYPAIFGVTPEQFSRQLDTLASSAEILGLPDIVDILAGRSTLPDRAVMITFDDGLREQYEVAWPILKQKGLPAVFFLNTMPLSDKRLTATQKIHVLRSQIAPEQLVRELYLHAKQTGKKIDFPSVNEAQKVYKYDTASAAQLKYYLTYMMGLQDQVQFLDHCMEIFGLDENRLCNDLYFSKNMCRELRRFDAIGSHGHSHLPLGLISDDDAVRDVARSLDLLQEWCGDEIESFSFPYGFYNACSNQVIDYVVSRGVKVAFTLERAGNKDLRQPLFLGRFSPNDIFEDENGELPNDFWERVQPTQWFG